MNAITAASGVSESTLIDVLATGNLRNLTDRQRLEYLSATCRSLGLNPLTRPIRFMQLSGQVVAYATRDAADQLRALKGVSVRITKQEAADGVYTVTVQATDKNGRTDEEIGAVPFGDLKGEARANAVMKAITKAKRRVTLSICGLGLIDETEAYSVAADARDRGDNPVLDMDAGAVIGDEIPSRIMDAPEPEPRKPTLRQKLAAAVGRINGATTEDDLHEWVGSTDRAALVDWLRANKPDFAAEIEAAESAAFARLREGAAP